MAGAHRQGVFDVGEQQFLVLLLVLQAEFDERGELGVVAARAQQCLQTFVDVRAPAFHVGKQRARDQAALGARELLADAVVVAVEEHAEARVEGAELRLEAFEQKGLEEPGHVREVPFHGARVGHRLHLAVFGRQRCGQPLAGSAHLGIPAGEGRPRLRLLMASDRHALPCAACPRAR